MCATCAYLLFRLLMQFIGLPLDLCKSPVCIGVHCVLCDFALQPNNKTVLEIQSKPRKLSDKHVPCSFAAAQIAGPKVIISDGFDNSV